MPPAMPQSRLLARRRYGEAIEAAHAAIRMAPLQESAYRLLLRVHLSAGNAGEATGTYATWREIAKRELDLEPSYEMRSLLVGG